jgi:hypothetical protein
MQVAFVLLVRVGMEGKKGKGKSEKQVPRGARNGRKERRGHRQKREAGSSRCSEWKERRARAKARARSRFLALLGMEGKKGSTENGGDMTTGGG